jgi:hypothetical protein
MARRFRVLVVVSVAAVSGLGVLATAGAASGGTVPAVRAADSAAGVWGRAVEVPGLGALNQGGFAEVGSVSCGPAGSCAAGGVYEDGHGDGQGFVVSEKNGQWSRAIEVPGLHALNTGGAARIYSVSCGSPGNCVAGGSYSLAGDLGDGQGFATVERNGRWGNAAEMPSRKPVTKGQYYAAVASVSCTPEGPCTVAGYYSGRDPEGFVVSENNGHWSEAIKVPTLGLPVNGDQIFSVSCPAPGSCAAGGSYLTNSGISYAFVVSEENGRWGSPMKIPGLAALPGSQDGGTEVYSVSCAAPGTCTAGGSLGLQAFATQDGTRARHTRTTAVPPRRKHPDKPK